MDIQRLRNLTTGRLHTNMADIYTDIEFFIGSRGVMTHQLPNALAAMTPWLKEQFPDPRLWDGQWDIGHVGDMPAKPMTGVECADFWRRYNALPDPLRRKG